MISTHTLTWSVTYQHLTLLSQFDISTHTLTWSVTIPDDFLRNIEVDFNSHAHVERDARNSSRNCVKKSFQLTRSRGAWPSTFQSSGLIGSFQLTRSRGAWRTIKKGFALAANFNSHAHVERDARPCERKCFLLYFNSHAHVERDRADT